MAPRYIIRRGLLIDKESFRDDTQRIPVSYLPAPAASRQQQLSPIVSRDGDPSRSPSLLAATLDRAMPMPVPSSELPDEWHIYAAQRDKRAFNLNNAATLAAGQPMPHLRYRVFPSMSPSSRAEVLQLAHVLEHMLARMPITETVHQLEIYDLVLSELVRQVWVQCSERGQLLGFVRRAYARLVRMSVERIGQLESAVRRLREDLSATDVSAAQRIAQLNALSFDDEHEARKGALLRQLRARMRYESDGLHLALDSYNRLNDEERVRLLHVLIATKLQRAQANVCTHALLATLPRAESHALLSSFLAESVSSQDLVLTIIPEVLRADTLRALVHAVARSSASKPGAPAAGRRALGSCGDERTGGTAGHAVSPTRETAGSGAYNEDAVVAHVILLLAEAEREVAGSAGRITAAAFEALALGAQRAAFLQQTGLAQTAEAAEAMLEKRVRMGPSLAQLERASNLYKAQLVLPLARPSPDPSFLHGLTSLLPGQSGSLGDSAGSAARRERRAAAPPRTREPLHSIGAFGLSGLVGARGRTVDEAAAAILRSSTLLSLDETLRQCGELLAARQEARALDERASAQRTPLPALIDVWAFRKHRHRSTARSALCSIAASIHHHATFTQHARVIAVARALGIGDSISRRAANRRASGVDGAARSEARDRDRESDDGDGDGSSDDDDDGDNAVQLEPPAFNPRLFDFFCDDVLESLLPSRELLDGAFGTTLPVHVPCETDAARERLPAAAALAQTPSPPYVDAFAIIHSLTELNQLHFDATNQLVDKLRPLLVPMPVALGAFSGVALPLDLLLTELLAVYAELEGERKARLLALFRKHDENGDGVLEYAEFERLALDFNPLLTPRDISRLFVDVLDESESRRKRGIDAAATARTGGDAPASSAADGAGDDEELVDVISAEGFAFVVDGFSTHLSAVAGSRRSLRGR